MNRRRAPWRLGDRVSVVFTDLAADGRAVGAVDGYDIHAFGALPGERCSVRVDAIDRARPRAHGVVVQVLEADPMRRAAPCRWHESLSDGDCSGCAWMPWTTSRQREAMLAHLNALGFPVDEIGVAPEQRDEGLGYRRSSKRVAFIDRGGRVRLGSYRRRTHRVARMTGCLIDHPSISECADRLENLLTERRFPVWKPKTEVGLRYVWFKTNGVQRLITLVTEGLGRGEVEQLVRHWPNGDGVAWCDGAGRGNAIRGDQVELLRGPAELEVALAGEQVSVGPLGFLQPNPTVAGHCYEALLADAHGQQLTGAVAFDLYAGAGLTTRRLQQGFERVFPCESYPESARRLGVEPMKTAQFLTSPPETQVDLVVANPPRAGLGEEVCERLISLAPARLHVMSCNPVTMARDIESLSAHFEMVREPGRRATDSARGLVVQMLRK